MVRTAAVVTVLTLLAGCGGAQQAVPTPQRPDAARAVDPVLAPALAGEQPRAAADPQALARQITVAETAVRDLANPSELVAAAGQTAQVAWRIVEPPAVPQLRTHVGDILLPIEYESAQSMPVEQWLAGRPR